MINHKWYRKFTEEKGPLFTLKDAWMVGRLAAEEEDAALDLQDAVSIK